jgi:hypothetical protein
LSNYKNFEQLFIRSKSTGSKARIGGLDNMSRALPLSLGALLETFLPRLNARQSVADQDTSKAYRTLTMPGGPLSLSQTY